MFCECYNDWVVGPLWDTRGTSNRCFYLRIPLILIRLEDSGSFSKPNGLLVLLPKRETN